MRKQIGIVGYFNADGTHFGVGAAYMLFFSEFGDVSIVSPTEMNVRNNLDLLVIPGGPDVDWKRYLKHEDQLSMFTQRPCNIRERFDHVLLPKYLEAGIPIFGICRGHQSLAVYFGSQLTQHMYHETNGKDRKELVHKVKYRVDLLSKFMNVRVKHVNKSKHVVTHVTEEVNSIHHQIVKNKPDNAIVLAEYVGKHEEAGTIEALYYPEFKAITVQWHPEEIKDAPSVAFINHLLTLK